MMYQDIHIHGGVVESVQAARDVIIHGGVVERLTAHGDCKQYGGIVERKIIQTGANANYQEPKVIYKDRIQWRDRIVYRDREKVVYKTPKEAADELRTVKGQARYWLKKSEELEAENKQLKLALEDTERQKLLAEIDDLRGKLKRARQRENVAVQARKDAERRANQTIANVWDQYRPTKEACKQLYENLKAFLDCETE